MDSAGFSHKSWKKLKFQFHINFSVKYFVIVRLDTDDNQ